MNLIFLEDGTHVARCPKDSISDLVGGGTNLLEVDHARVGWVAPRVLGLVGGRHVDDENEILKCACQLELRFDTDSG